MEHRRFLAHPEAHHPFAGGGLLRRVGGPTAVAALVDALYDGIETDAALRPLFGRDLAGEREAQKRFFAEWLGGDTGYSDRAHLPLKHRHDLLPITGALAEKWLAHFRDALTAAVSDLEARRLIEDQVGVLAMALINEGAEPSPLRARPHGTCLRYQPAIESVHLARRGDAAALPGPCSALRASSAPRRMPRVSCSLPCLADAELSSSSFSIRGSMSTSRRRLSR
jgi:truncated hemoglobin YjbI